MKMKKIAAVLTITALGVSLLAGCGGKKAEELVLFTWEGMFPQEILDGFEKETGIKVVYSNFDTDETLAGCGGKKAEELVLFTWEGMFPQEILDGFEKETGIKVVYSNFDTDETMLEKLSQAKGGDYDVVIADDYIIEKAVEQKLVKTLDKEKIKNFDNINPLFQGSQAKGGDYDVVIADDYIIEKAVEQKLVKTLDKEKIKNFDNINPLFQGQFYDENNEYTVPYGSGIPLIVYDPSQVDIEIKGYSDLWDPSLEDSIASLEDSIALVANYRVICGITQLSMGESMNEENPEVIAKTGERLKELAPNVRMIQDDNTQNALLNGEASVGFLYTSQVTAALAENPDLKVVYPQEGLGFGIMNMFIPENAPSEDAAYKFIDYILEPENAAECFNYIGYYSTNKAADEMVNPNLVVPEILLFRTM